MTGEEAIQALLDRIAAKRARVGEFTLSAQGLEQLLRESLLPLEKRPEPGYPKKMLKSKPNETPWVPKGPEVPFSTWVNNRKEEDEAYSQGFRASGEIYL